MKEARIVINGFLLTEAQASVVRIAVSDFRMSLQDPEQRAAFGAIAEGYEARLHEVELLLIEEETPERSSRVRSWHSHHSWWCSCIENQLVRAESKCPRCGQDPPPEAERPS